MSRGPFERSNLALLSPMQTQDKTWTVAATSSQLGLKVNRAKNKVNVANAVPIRVDSEALEEVENLAASSSWAVLTQM